MDDATRHANLDPALEMLGLVSLRQKLAAQTWAVDTPDASLANYYAVARVRWSGAEPAEAPVDKLVEFFEWAVIQIIAEDGRAQEDPATGRVWIDCGGAMGRIEVTAHAIEHWCAMHTILTDESVAREVMRQTPAYARAKGDEAERRVVEDEFARVTGGLSHD